MITVPIVSINLLTNNTYKYDIVDKIIAELENKGMSVEVSDKKPYSLECIHLTINQGDKITVYIYESSQKMEEYAEGISPGSSTVHNGKMILNFQWASTPHYYKKGYSIALYVGDNSEIINCLEQIMGKALAGF